MESSDWFENILEGWDPEADENKLTDFLNKSLPFRRLLNEYQCAMMEVETKLKVLDTEFSIDSESNPIESITSRIKSPVSIITKLKGKGLKMTVGNLDKHINDIAGIRVVCSFQNDVYLLVRALKKQPDIRVVKETDYIDSPKENGYRSYHLVVEVPIFLSDRTSRKAVEVQFRTIAMDSWASLEHKIRYKKSIDENAEIRKKLLSCAQMSSVLDREMQLVRDLIEKIN